MFQKSALVRHFFFTFTRDVCIQFIIAVIKNDLEF